jgi:hypothetical protein
MNGYCQLGRNEFELNGCKPAFSWLTVSKTNNIVHVHSFGRRYRIWYVTKKQ